MTSGYEPHLGQPDEPSVPSSGVPTSARGTAPGVPGPRQPGSSGPDARFSPPDSRPSGEGTRPGPLPPRFEPPHSPNPGAPHPPGFPPQAPGYPSFADPVAAGWPSKPGTARDLPGYSSVPHASPSPATPPAASGLPAATPPLTGANPPAGPYGAPANPAAVPSAPPGVAGGPPAMPHATAVLPGGPVQPGMGPVVQPARRPVLAIVALTLAGLLLVVTGVQAFQLHQLGNRLAATDRRVADGQQSDGSRLDGLDGRTRALEKQVGAVFNPEAIATAVLPSVFRVRAGQFTGTAFAVGKPAEGGGTNLFTNFHVVESVWNAGQKNVFLERTDQRFPATIVKVDKENDVAQLRTDSRFNGLVMAPAPVKSGQQIVVVGAPLGLEDSVSSGIVSAFRKSDDGPGEVIQFDAPINPGNSGGPVINGAKQVVGIATAKARNAEGIGLAVPIKTACDHFKIC